MVGTKRVILLAGYNFINPGCNTNIDAKLIIEFDLTTYLGAEIFKRERLIGIDLIIKARNDFGNLVNEVNSLNGEILISCHFTSMLMIEKHKEQRFYMLIHHQKEES